VKPISKKASKEGFLQVGVETYGGGLWHTWFDRDLSLAGKVIGQSGKGLKEYLVDLKRPILRVPTLAIHLDRGVNESFKFNNENQLTPILSTLYKSTDNADSMSHHLEMLQLIADEIKIKPEDILSVDLCLYDSQPPCLGGSRNEFIFSGRLDNLYLSYCSIQVQKSYFFYF
jgi:aspartyl aminopeptidase